jgi:transcriptional regulator of acetoin/glycerol metabolism
LEALTAYDWPGNVRELQNVIDRALILSPGPALQVDEALGRPRAPGPPPASPAGTLEEAERAHVLRVLEECGWVVEGPGQAAERLGLRPSTLRSRMRKLRILRPGRGGASQGRDAGAGAAPDGARSARAARR